MVTKVKGKNVDTTVLPSKEVYTVEDVAAILNIGKNQCYDGVKKGWIPSIKLGRKFLIPKKLLDQFLASPKDYTKAR